MSRGHIKLHRKLQDNPMWLSEKFTDGQAWVDLLMLANYALGTIKKRGIRIHLKRGEIGWSEIELGKRWQWSRGKVRRFLNWLFEQKMVQQVVQQTVQQKSKITTHLKIINYDSYQLHGTTDDTIDSTSNGHQTDIKRYRKKLNKINNTNKNKDIYISQFEIFFKNYPKRVGKKKALESFIKLKPSNGMYEKILKSLEDHKKCKQWQDPEYIPMPASWLNQRRFDDELPKQELRPWQEGYVEDK